MNKKILIPEKLAIKKPNPSLLAKMNNKKFKDKILFELESDFHYITVAENEAGRFVHFNNTYQAGFINTDYYKGNLPYINYFLIPYLMNQKIKKILLIGLGTGKLVNDFEILYPDLKNIDVVDIEINMPFIASEYFNFIPSEKFKFILQDGITYLRSNKTKYDLIVTDVANNVGIDLRFLQSEYFNLIKSALKKSGIFVSNMCASPDFSNKKNIFFKKYFPIYKKYFNNNTVFKGNYSDKIYYKSFYNIDERVTDITNVIIISSDKDYKISSNEKLVENFKKLNIDIKKYLLDKCDNC